MNCSFGTNKLLRETFSVHSHNSLSNTYQIAASVVDKRDRVLTKLDITPTANEMVREQGEHIGKRDVEIQSDQDLLLIINEEVLSIPVEISSQSYHARSLRRRTERRLT